MGDRQNKPFGDMEKIQPSADPNQMFYSHLFISPSPSLAKQFKFHYIQQIILLQQIHYIQQICYIQQSIVM